jgi:hypothetical protein
LNQVANYFGSAASSLSDGVQTLANFISPSSANAIEIDEREMAEPEESDPLAGSEASLLRQQIWGVNPGWGEIRNPGARDDWGEVEYLQGQLAEQSNAQGGQLLGSPGPNRVNPWQGEILSTETIEDITMYRVWGNKAPQTGPWLTQICLYLEAPHRKACLYRPRIAPSSYPW